MTDGKERLFGRKRETAGRFRGRQVSQIFGQSFASLRNKKARRSLHHVGAFTCCASRLTMFDDLLAYHSIAADIMRCLSSRSPSLSKYPISIFLIIPFPSPSPSCALAHPTPCTSSCRANLRVCRFLLDSWYRYPSQNSAKYFSFGDLIFFSYEKRVNLRRKFYFKITVKLLEYFSIVCTCVYTINRLKFTVYYNKLCFNVSIVQLYKKKRNLPECIKVPTWFLPQYLLFSCMRFEYRDFKSGGAYSAP